MENNQNYSVCSSCKGQCCKSLPGIVSPQDLEEISVDSLTKLYEEGYQFDFWEGNLTGDLKHEEMTFYYLRPQTKKSVGRVVDASWGGECVFLTASGCSMEFKDRPMQCKALKPSPDLKCSMDKKYEKVNMIKDWIPYNEIIEKTIDRIYDSSRVK